MYCMAPLSARKGRLISFHDDDDDDDEGVDLYFQHFVSISRCCNWTSEVTINECITVQCSASLIICYICFNRFFY